MPNKLGVLNNKMDWKSPGYLRSGGVGGLNVLIVGKIIPWAIRKPMLTRVRVSLEGVTALFHRVAVTCMATFHRNIYMCYI